MAAAGTLRFSDTRLESRWQASQASRRRTWDAAFFVVFALPASTAGYRALQVDGTAAQKLVNPIVLALYLAILLFISLRPGVYTRWRSVTLAAFKLAFSAAISAAVMNHEEPTADTWPQFVRFELLLYQKGLISLILAVMLPQPFPWHCAVQSCLALLFLAVTPGVCTAFHARQPSNYGRYQQVVAWLDAALPPAASPRQRACPLAECGQAYCMHVQAALSIAVGFVLSSLAVYAMERRARRCFLLGRLQACGGAQPPPRKRGWQLAWLVLCTANLAAGLALLWREIGWLYSRRLPSYGVFIDSAA